METPALDARLLLRQGGHFSDADLIAGGSTPLPVEVVEKTMNLLSRRLEGEPVSRIAGEREFWGLTFKVTKDTLDPRPDTETLVEAALKRGRAMLDGRETGLAAMASSGWRGDGLRILELGTGTGCVLISLLKELPEATGVGIDLNPGAVAVSRENATQHSVDNRVEFLCGSWFEPLEARRKEDGREQEQGGADCGRGSAMDSGADSAMPGKERALFDLIVSNPPYICESHIESLAPEVRNHDPILALSGGADGLDAYKTILKDLKKHLACDGFALFEIGAGQEKDLARLVADSMMAQGESYRDLAGIPRVVEIGFGENWKYI